MSAALERASRTSRRSRAPRSASSASAGSAGTGMQALLGRATLPRSRPSPMPSPEALAQRAQLAPGPRRSATLDELLAHDLDGVVIATPSALHAEQAMRGARARPRGVLPEAAGAHRRRDAARSSTRRARPTGCSASTSRYRHTAAMRRIRELRGGGRARRRSTRSTSCSTTPTAPTSRGSATRRSPAAAASSTSASTWSTSRCGCWASQRSQRVTSRLFAQGRALPPASRRGRGLRRRAARSRRRRGRAARLLVEPRRRPRRGDRGALPRHRGGAVACATSTARSTTSSAERFEGTRAHAAGRAAGRLGRPRRRRLGAAPGAAARASTAASSRVVQVADGAGRDLWPLSACRTCPDDGRHRRRRVDLRPRARARPGRARRARARWPRWARRCSRDQRGAGRRQLPA